MNFDGDDDSSDNEKPPISIIFNNGDGHLSPIGPPVMLVPSTSASTIRDEEDEDCSDASISFSSSLDSSSSQSLELNPNSSIDNLDLPGIALLKEIFPEETTETLRELHYKHILSNKTPPPGPRTKISTTPGDSSDHSKKNCQEDQPVRRPKLESLRRSIPITELPDDDFLRLPKSVAVLRERVQMDDNEDDRTHSYELIQDLEAHALEEYHLAATASSSDRINPGRNNIDYNTYVVEKDNRWGLGMTLQEVVEEGDHLRFQQQSSSAGYRLPQHRIVRFGLMVIGFLPDRKKVESGEIVSNIARSPAEAVGIQRGDVLIGINGTAFLLQLPLSPSTSHTVDRQSSEYKIQKEKIIQSIQKSPSPSVLHVRRRQNRHLGSIGESFSERSVASLLDSTALGEKGGEFYPPRRKNFGTVPHQLSGHDHSIQRHPADLLYTSPSSAFFKPVQTPTSNSSTPVRHPLSIALARRKLIRTGEDQQRITRRLQQFTERARQYESSNSLRITRTGKGGGAGRGTLVPHFDPNDLPPEIAELMLFPPDGGTGSVTEIYPKAIESQNRKPDFSSGMVHSDEYKIDEEQNEQNLEQYHHHSPVGPVACGPSTPPLPFDSPLIPLEYLQAFYGHEKAHEIRYKSKLVTIPTATNEFSPRRLFWPNDASERPDKRRYFLNDIENPEDMTWIPLHGVRKALSARILNSFVETGELNRKDDHKSRIAYTIWVYDVESGCEWYAPIRYWEDFSELREASLALLPSNSEIHKELSNLKVAKEPAIPTETNSIWSVSMFGTSSLKSPMSPSKERRRQKKNEEFEEARQETCQLLEEFLRELLGIIYTCNPLHPNAAEIALYVQSFLGVDAGLHDSKGSVCYDRSFDSITDRKEDETRQSLKRSIQRYSWRVFLLHTMKAIVMDFVSAARARGPKLHEIESMESGDKGSLKARAMKELLQIQKFLDQLVDLIIDGCNDDLRSIAARHEYSRIHKYLADDTYWDRLVRESVREQVEIEVYVPLRSIVSRLLVNGWRHEDMEVLFKMKELRKRPQGMFRIDKISPSHWQSVAQILNQGVGISTLPCVKLRAIVDAAREISQLHAKEHGENALLGADEFLPIFIFCVVRAQMERPCALSILLQTLCDRINRTGEVGYFLASFEAAIAHIKEIDLTEDREDMLSFLTVPLTEVSLSEQLHD